MRWAARNSRFHRDFPAPFRVPKQLPTALGGEKREREARRTEPRAPSSPAAVSRREIGRGRGREK